MPTRRKKVESTVLSSEEPPEDLVVLADDLGTVIARAYMSIRRPLFRETVSFPRMRMLSILLDNGPQRISQLAYADQVSQPSLTLMVDGMEEQGLLERRPDPNDKRAVLVALTDRGEAEIKRVRLIRSKALAKALDTLPPRAIEDLQAATAALEGLVSILSSPEEQNEGAYPVVSEAGARNGRDGRNV